MTNTVKACNTVNLLDKTTYDQQVRPDTELWAVDEESDSDYKGMVAGWGMPSDTYEDLTAGASGTEYTAPSNGYFAVSKMMGTNSSIALIALGGSSSELYGTRYQNSTNDAREIRLLLPAKKGGTVKLEYAAGGSFAYFRFIYAEGEV